MKQLTVILILFTQVLFAQKEFDGLWLNRTTIEYGEVENWISSVDSILIKNNSSKRLLLLKLKHPSEFEIKFPTRGLGPGEQGFIKFIYKPKRKGSFNQKLKLYHSGSNDPFFITFKGKVLSFDPYSNLACPSFATPNFQRFLFDLEVQVVDSNTNQPINKALVEIYKRENFVQILTDKKGTIKHKSNVGLYDFFVVKDGYAPRTASQYFNPRNRKLIIKLPRLKPGIVYTPIEVDDRTTTLTTNKSNPELTKDPEKEISYPKIDENQKTDDGEFSLSKYKKNNLVFLVDVSSSMRGKDRLDLLKVSMAELVKLLRPEDEITLISYSDEAKVLLKGISGDQKELINTTIKNLKALGSTQGGKAIKKAYKISEANFIKEGNNQIILATDGGFSGLGKSEKSLNRLVNRKTKKGIYFSVLAFGKNKYGKGVMRDLANSGQGNYLYIKDLSEAQKELKETIKEQSKK